ncbi:MAG: ArnT family glycosyltransferase, partial [Bacteroidia bacterium]
YIGEYLWYNPLIAFVEAGVIKLTGIPPMGLVTKGGALLNIVSVFMFYLMVTYLFGSSVAIAATASFLFFTSGNIPSWGAATYSPWLYPQNFVQSIFYLGIICCCKAFSKPGYTGFLIAGAVTGIAFLGHTAPALILLFITGVLFLKSIYQAVKIKLPGEANKFMRLGFLFSLVFIIVSLPLTFFVIGKYKLHMVNTITFEYNDPLFIWFNFLTLIKENISFTLPFVLIGCFYILYKLKDKLKRNFLFYWFGACVLFFIYTSVITILRVKWGLRFPGLVPAFHFFFYLKALQSVLFGIGFIYLLQFVYRKIKKRNLKNEHLQAYTTLLVLLVFLIYYPVYSKRQDFYFMREYGLKQSAASEEIEIYHWLLHNSSINVVIVCDEDFSCFPVMASGRKLVAVIATMSNPYVSYVKRNADRNLILNSLHSGSINNAKELLNEYSVKFILLENSKIKNETALENNFGEPIFKNNKFSIYKN